VTQKPFFLEDPVDPEPYRIPPHVSSLHPTCNGHWSPSGVRYVQPPSGHVSFNGRTTCSFNDRSCSAAGPRVWAPIRQDMNFARFQH